MPTLLLVDKNSSRLAMISDHLRDAMPDLTIVSAQTCREARLQAGRFRPEVILLDCILPDGNGFLLFEELKMLLPKVQGIFASDLLLSQSSVKKWSQGRVDVLPKPFDYKRLIEMVHRMLTDVQGQARAQENFFPTFTPAELVSHQRIANRLTSLLIGLQAFGADLRAAAESAEEVNAVIDEYLDRLIDTVWDLAQSNKKDPQHHKRPLS